MRDNRPHSSIAPIDALVDAAVETTIEALIDAHGNAFNVNGI
jgi:hypothetical protein